MHILSGGRLPYSQWPPSPQPPLLLPLFGPLAERLPHTLFNAAVVDGFQPLLLPDPQSDPLDPAPPFWLLPDRLLHTVVIFVVLLPLFPHLQSDGPLMFVSVVVCFAGLNCDCTVVPYSAVTFYIRSQRFNIIFCCYN
jgi:hypothetical protein